MNACINSDPQVTMLQENLHDFPPITCTLKAYSPSYIHLSCLCDKHVVNFHYLCINQVHVYDLIYPRSPTIYL